MTFGYRPPAVRLRARDFVSVMRRLEFLSRLIPALRAAAICADVAGTVRNGQPGHALLVPAGSIRCQQLPFGHTNCRVGFSVAPFDFLCIMAEMVGFDSKGGAAAPAKPAKQEPLRHRLLCLP